MRHNFFKAVFNFTNVVNNRVRNVGLLSKSICKSIINFFLLNYECIINCRLQRQKDKSVHTLL